MFTNEDQYQNCSSGSWSFTSAKMHIFHLSYLYRKPIDFAVLSRTFLVVKLNFGNKLYIYQIVRSTKMSTSQTSGFWYSFSVRANSTPPPLTTMVKLALQRGKLAG